MFSRNELLWGEENQKLLNTKHIVVFGIGAVGGYALEMLARCGVGKITIVDFDTIDISNINRQIIALNSNLGKKKTTEFEKRLKDINPNIILRIFDTFYSDNLNEEIFGCKVDAVIDAIDTMKSKIQLLKYCYVHNIFCVSSMGAGNKFNPAKFVIKDISEIDKVKNPFTNNIIRILKREGIKSNLVAVYSDETIKPKIKIQKSETVKDKLGQEIKFDKITPASVSFVTAVSGAYCTYAVINNFINF